MKELTEADLQEQIERYAEGVRLEHPRFYRTPLKTFVELAAKYPEAVDVDHHLAMDRHGNRTLLHQAVDADGGACGPPVNDSNPCPPFWE